MYKYMISVLFLLSLLIYGCGRKAPVWQDDVFELEEKNTEKKSADGGTAQKEAAQEETAKAESVSGTKADLPEEESACYVYVCGEVNAPGVYKLPTGSRVYEAIQLAGGLTEEADDAAVNQALFLTDGQMIQVFAKGEEQKNASGENAEDGRINLNTADIQALMGIPGIGEAKAKSIIAYREENGNFQSAEDVMKITGIKEGLYSKMKDYITVK